MVHAKMENVYANQDLKAQTVQFNIVLITAQKKENVSKINVSVKEVMMVLIVLISHALTIAKIRDYVKTENVTVIQDLLESTAL